MEKKDKKKMLITAVIVAIILSLLSLTYYFYEKSFTKVEYSQFNKMANSEEIEQVEIDFNAAKFKFKDKSGNKYITENPKSFNFKKSILEKGIEVKEIQGRSRLIEMVFSLFGTVVSVGLMVYLLKGFMDTGIANPDLAKKNDNVKTRFKDIAGNEEAKEDMMFLVNFLKDPKRYTDMGAKLPKGVILFGAPGTGKTLTARAIAGEAGVPFFNVSGSDFIEMYAGLGAKRVRTLFQEAKKAAPCIVFIDEIDALGTNRGEMGHSEKDQTINALLSEMDGFEASDGVIVMAATNRMEDLDRALIRPGRFDRHIAIELPEYKDRLSILKLHSSNKNLAEDVDLESLAKMTIGFSGAGLEALLNEATINAVNRSSDKVEFKDIDEAHFKMVVKGNKKKDSDRSKRDTELVAYHEAGHALLAKLLTENDVPKVTIIPSTSGVGGATFNIPKKMYLWTRKDIENEITVLYGGRAAEEILRGSKDLVTTGASNDIERATDLIKSYFNNYGMSDKYGMLKISSIKEGEILEDAIDMSERLYSKAIGLLRDNKDKLDKISYALMEKETILEDELDEIVFGKEEEEVIEEE